MDYILDFKTRLFEAGFTAHQVENISTIALLALEKYDVTPRTALVVYDESNENFIKKFFVAKISNGLSPRSLQYYKTILSTVFRKLNRNIKDVTADDIRIYLAKRKLENVCGRTLDNERRVLSSFFTFLRDEDLIDTNPMKKIPKIKAKKQVKKALTEDELELLRCKARGLRDKAIIEFLYSTGCRVSEMCALNRDDLNLQNGEVFVTGKGDKERKVYMSVRCRYAIKVYLDERTDKCEALFVGCPSVYPKHERHLHMTRIGVGRIEEMLRTLGRKCGIENVHPHRFRRTCATLALNRGMPLEQVKQMLGHEQISTTLIYTEQNTEQLKQSHEKFII